MIQVETIKNFFPLQVRNNATFYKYMLKEYIFNKDNSRKILRAGDFFKELE